MKELWTSGFLLPVMLIMSLFPLTGFAQDFKIHENGVTILCDLADPGDTGIVNGQTYTAVDRAMLISKRDAGEDLSAVCTSLITDMSRMFLSESDFNGDLSAWDVSSVTDMTQMFYSASSFNGDLSNWDVSSVTDMSQMFYNASSFNGDLSNWDVSSVTDMSYMFEHAKIFNSDISSWNVSSVTDMSQMFNSASSFDGDLSNWDVSSVKNMSHMFYSATSFNGNISNWDVSSVSNMYGMFNNASDFNGDLSKWDVSSVTNMRGMFEEAISFIGDLSTWDVSSVTNFGSMFSGATSFNGDLSTWDVSSATNMRFMFSDATSFNGDLSAWNVSSVTSMSGMFRNAISFNGDISNWDVSSVTDMQMMFNGASLFNEDLSKWDVSSVTNMSGMFQNATSFNGDLSTWNVSSVTHTSSMFSGATSFNNDLSTWDVSSVRYMIAMFKNATSFNGDLSEWNVSSVTYMSDMFHSATSFNGNLSAWDVSSVSNMDGMFHSATSFTGDLSEWDVSSVRDMDGMFHSATSFNGDLSMWDVSSVIDMSNMFHSATSFNGDLSAWDVSSVMNMSGMFQDATSFNGIVSSWNVISAKNMNYMFYNAINFKNDLRSWCVKGIVTLPDDFATNSALDSENLPFWGECPISVTINGTEGWRMLSSPVANKSYADLLDPIWTQGMTGSDSPDHGSPNVQTFDGNSFQPVTDLSAIVPAGQGFITYVYADEDYDGTPDPFPKNLFAFGAANPIIFQPALSKGAAAWSLVGNPSTKTIDWETNVFRGGLTGVVYVYDHNYGSNYVDGDIPEIEYGGGYRTWNGLAGSLTDGLIAPFQGFWVQNDDTSESSGITFFRSSASTGTFYKETPQEDEQKEPITIKLRSEMGNMFSETYLTFSEQASIGKDNFDALKLTPLDFRNYLSLATTTGDHLLDINNLPSDFTQLEIPLSISAFTANKESGKWESKAGDITLSWSEMSIPEEWQIILNDYETGQSIDLLSAEKYEFSLSETAVSMNKAVTSVLSPITPQVQKRAKSSSDNRFVITIKRGKSVSNEITEIPQHFALEQNYPNPFNPSTVISYQLAVNSDVKLAIFDMAGRKVATLVDGHKNAGTYKVSFDASGLSSGIYFYRLQAAGNVMTKQMTLIK